jgi:parvulin-like peptidyl-prolyl isomerase
MESRGRSSGSARDAAGPTHALIVNGEPVRIDALVPALAEASGSTVVREFVLDRMIAAELDRRGIVLGDDEVAAERDLLSATLNGDDSTGEIARRRGLGPTRFPAFVYRSAALRRLVSVDAVPESEVAREAAIRFGPAVRARLVVAATERDAAEARAAALADPAGPSPGMAAAATARSLDPSAIVGGLFERTSPTDPRWPEAVAEQLRTLAPNEVSPVVRFEGGAAIVLVEDRFPGADPSAGDLDAIRRDLTLRREREAMTELADRLVRRADVTVLDPGLEWATRGSLRR